MNRAINGKGTLWNRIKRDMCAHWMLYLFVLPAVVAVALFSYWPMYGVQIAFRKFKPVLGIIGSPWVGLDNFIRFVQSYQFELVLRNTITISLYGLVAGFPTPILLALMLNQIQRERYKRVLQTVTYMPHFISTVVLCGMVSVFLNASTGLYGNLARAVGVRQPLDVLGSDALFSTIYVLSGVWQHTGWDSVIYLAALSGIDPTLYEAATVDGASSAQKVWHIDLPGILPTAIILLILNSGSIMSVGFEKVYLLQNDLNIDASEVIATYVYKIGMLKQQYSFSAAVGLFNTVVNFVILLGVNWIASRVSETSLW